MTTNKPVHEIKEGRIRAAIWANDGKNGIRYTVTLERLYKQEGSWKKASSFYLDDIETLMTKVLPAVSSWIRLDPESEDAAKDS
jgi:hypothetical protein